jgi:hypothetical protein
MHLLNSEADVLQHVLVDLEETFYLIDGKEHMLGSTVPIPIFHALSTLLTTIAKVLLHPSNHCAFYSTDLLKTDGQTT